MIEIETTREFDEWLRRLKDKQGRARILSRIARIRDRGLFGDLRSVGGKVRELRVDSGPGYRVYFVQPDATLVLLLCAGEKGSQARDIDKAKELADSLE